MMHVLTHHVFHSNLSMARRTAFSMSKATHLKGMIGDALGYAMWGSSCDGRYGTQVNSYVWRSSRFFNPAYYPTRHGHAFEGVEAMHADHRSNQTMRALL